MKENNRLFSRKKLDTTFAFEKNWIQLWKKKNHGKNFKKLKGKERSCVCIYMENSYAFERVLNITLTNFNYLTNFSL